MKKYQYLASWDDQTLTRVGEPVVVLGDSNVSQVEVTLPSNFLLDPTKAECRMYFLLPGEKESDHDVLETATKDENGDSHVTWTIKHVHSQKGGRLAFSLTLIGDDAQWDSRTAIIPVYESRYQPESEEAEKPYTGRLDALEGSMAAIRGEFAEVQDDFEELKETATLGTPIPESLVANMQEGHIYVYTGTEPGYTAGHVYYYADGVLKDGGVYGGTAVDATLTKSGQAADAKKTGDEISQIKEDLSALEDSAMLTDKIGLTVDEWTPSAIISSTNYLQTTGYPSSQGRVYSASSSLKASGFIPLYGKMLEVPIIHTTDTTYPNYGLSLYDADFRPIYGRAVSAEPNRTDTYIHWAHIYIPENAKYFRITYFADDTTAITEGHAPAFTYNLLKDIPEAYKPITHELPVDTYMQNAIRRARQLTDIRWTPRVNIPRYSMINGSNIHFLDWFSANKEYKGIPYSGAGGDETTSNWTTPKEWGYAHNWVGGCVPFDAFVTAARYPNSIFSETANQSAYNYNSSPYGVVCTALVNYAVNGQFPLRAINNFFGTPDRVFRYPLANNKISEIDANAIAIGDFLYTREHVIMITDIIRDINGTVTHVEMSEATTVGNGNNNVLGSKFGGVARRKMWAYSEFKSRYGEYVKYRRTTFYGIPYNESAYVDTGNEGDKTNIVDYPCIPYLGNGAVYRVGYIHNSKICIGATGFTTLIVLKDGTLFGTFTITGLTEIDVSFSEIGEYEAYLAMDAEGTNRTISCRWKVIDGVS